MHSGKLELKRGITMTAAVTMATIGCLLGLLVGSALAAETPGTWTGTIGAGAEANEYTLTLGDAAGNVWPMEFGPAWYKTYAFAVEETITVTGELDTGRDGTKKAEIDVASYSGYTGDTSVTPASGTIREAGGPPPWAGGPKNHDKVRGDGGTPDDDGAPDLDD